MLVAALPLLTAAAAQPACPPALLFSDPANGAVVAPGVRTLRWTFDRPMRTNGWSVTGRPDLQPTFMGPPTWSADGRTFSLRMVLKPGRTYDLGVNSIRHQGFRGLDGTPAAVRRVRFSTSR